LRNARLLRILRVLSLGAFATAACVSGEHLSDAPAAEFCPSLWDQVASVEASAYGGLSFRY
jgi:hypothetical protein